LERTCRSIAWVLLAWVWFAFGAPAVAGADGPAEAVKPVIVGYVFPRDGALAPDAIAAEKLTHVNYAFAPVRAGRLAAASPDAAKDLATLVSLRRRNPQLRILVSAGGWEGSRGFSDLALAAASRRTFARSVVEYLRRHDLDGFDLDWEYPGLPGAGNPHRPADRAHFTALLAELRRALDADAAARGRRLLLTIAAATSAEYLEHADMAAAQASLDLVNLMTYDFALAEAGDKAGHHANLRAPAGNPEAHSADKAVKAFLAAGVPAGKLVLGVPFYGRAWSGVSSVSDLGHKGRPAGEGFDARYGALAGLPGRDGWVRGWDAAAQAPYLLNAQRRLFVSYDDPESLRVKSRFVLDHGLAGVMFWEYHADPTGALLDALWSGLRGSR
jgi:chitinase